MCRFFSQRFAQFRDETLVPVISCEGLASEFLEMEDNFHAEVHARRLREAFGKCKIVLIIREQASHLVSKYRKNLETKRRSNVALSSFLRDRRLGQRVQTDCDSIFLPVLRHHNLVRLYWELFGPQNTLVIPFEMMSQRPAEFVKRLNNFCGSRIPEQFVAPRTNKHGVLGLSSFYRAYNTMYSPMTISMLLVSEPPPSLGTKVERPRLVCRANIELHSEAHCLYAAGCANSHKFKDRSGERKTAPSRFAPCLEIILLTAIEFCRK